MPVWQTAQENDRTMTSTTAAVSANMKLALQRTLQKYRFTLGERQDLSCRSRVRQNVGGPDSGECGYG
jgi:hypothetical protein